MKQRNTVSVLYGLAALGFYIAAILNFLDTHSWSSEVTIYACLGTTMLCLYVDEQEQKK